MLNWSIRDFLKHAQNYRDQLYADPKPFPGVDPIRWFVKISYQLDMSRPPIFEYLGKPNLCAARALCQIFLNKKGRAFYADIAEFDRGSVFFRTSTFVHRQNAVQTIGDYNTKLVTYYRPYTTVPPLEWAVYGLVRQRLIVKEKPIACYTYDNLGDEQWQRHKRWLDAAGLPK